MIVDTLQLAAFEEHAIRGFRSRLAEYLALVYPEQAAAADALAVTGQAIHFGKANGLATERDIASLACAMLLLGGEFADDARFPWARAILGDQRANKGDRLHECARIESAGVTP